MKLNHRILLAGSLALFALPVLNAQAQTFPSRTMPVMHSDGSTGIPPFRCSHGPPSPPCPTMMPSPFGPTSICQPHPPR